MQPIICFSRFKAILTGNMIFLNQEHDLIKPEMSSQTSYGKNTNQQELQTIFTFEKSLLIICTYLLIPQLCNVVT